MPESESFQPNFDVNSTFDGDEEIAGDELPVMDFDDHNALQGSGDDDAPPEAVPLITGKKTALARSRHMMNYEAEQRKRKRQANKAHSEAMSSRKAANQAKSKKHAREDIGNDSFASFDGLQDPDESLDSPAPDAPGLDHRDRQASPSAEVTPYGGMTVMDVQRRLVRSTEPPIDPDSKPIPQYLSDEIFAKAAASRSAQNLFSADTVKASKKDKRKVVGKLKTTSRKRVKDVILGSRTIRPLPVTQQIGLHIALQRPQAVRDFRSKRLNGDGMQNNKGWARIEPHLARSMRRSGPSPRFAQHGRS